MPRSGTAIAPPPRPSTNTDPMTDGVASTNTSGAATSHRGARPRRCAAHPSRAPTTAPGSRTPSNVPNQSNVDSGPAISAMTDRSAPAHASPHTAPTSTGVATARRVPSNGSTPVTVPRQPRRPHRPKYSTAYSRARLRTPSTGCEVTVGFEVGLDGVAPGDLRVEPPAVLDRAGLRGVVDGDDPEALRVAVGPLEVVHQRPHEVPVHP